MFEGRVVLYAGELVASQPAPSAEGDMSNGRLGPRAPLCNM